MDLFADQITSVTGVSAALREGDRRVILQSPTGAGKTVMACHMLERLHSAGKRWQFIVHRKELADQTSRVMKALGVPHGFIMAGRKETNDPIQIASIDTLRARFDLLEQPDGVFIDECHRSAAASYVKIFEGWPDSYAIGLTGTPTRLDGKPLDMYQRIVAGPSVRSLMDSGRLAKYQLFSIPPSFDGSAVRIGKSGEFTRAEMLAAMSGSTIYSDAVREYSEHCPGAQAVAMCIDIEHAERMAELFTRAGYPAAAIHGKLSAQHRIDIDRQYRAGRIRVLTSVNLLIEGYDVPNIQAVIFARMTASLVIYLQAIGRALRAKKDGSKGIIFDLVGNFPRHGYPDEDRIWTLEGRGKRKRASSEEELPAPKLCPVHFEAVRRPDLACSVCGYLPEKEVRKIEERPDIRLEEIDVEAARIEARQEEARAETLADFQRIGERRNYGKQWAWMRWKSKKRKKANADY